jgi:hypothetical protein
MQRWMECLQVPLSLARLVCVVAFQRSGYMQTKGNVIVTNVHLNRNDFERSRASYRQRLIVASKLFVLTTDAHL